MAPPSPADLRQELARVGGSPWRGLVYMFVVPLTISTFIVGVALVAFGGLASVRGWLLAAGGLAATIVVQRWAKNADRFASVLAQRRTELTSLRLLTTHAAGTSTGLAQLTIGDRVVAQLMVPRAGDLEDLAGIVSRHVPSLTIERTAERARLT